MKYLIKNENEIIIGATFEALVEQLRNGSKFAGEEALPAYMKGFAERYEQSCGMKISIESPEAFILDLTKSEYLILQ